MNVVDNTRDHRFELTVGSEVAVSGYRLNGNIITFTHTIVPESLRGGGIGNQIARAALDSARARGLKVIAECPFIAAFIRRHPEYQDLLVNV
jgi:predicted GNAT family acetyltransferase